MNSASVLIVLFLEMAGGKNLYWQPNSNWGNPSNWALGRIPGCNDAVSLDLVPSNSVVYLDVDTAVHSISLPADGQLVLGPSVTIQLSDNSECTVPGDTQPMAAAVENEFIGAAAHYWECAGNWLTEDDLPVEHPPCGDDKAIFDQGAFSFVKANDSITVRSLSVRGTGIQSQTELSSAEFNLKVEINSDCGAKPSFCPCPNEGMCPKSYKPPAVVGEAQASNLGGVVGGVVFGIVVVLAVVSVVIIVIVLVYVRKRSTVGYVKDELLEDGTVPVSSAPNNLYDNPVYDEEQVKVDLAASLGKVPDLEGVPEGNVSPGIITEADPPLYAEPEDNEEYFPKLNKYGRL